MLCIHKSLIKKAVILILSFLAIHYAKAQLFISGKTCVVAGTQYQYTISGNWNSSTSMSWQITGGVISGTTNTAQSGTPLPNIYVVWNTNTTSGTVSLTSSIGNAILNVTVPPLLNGGSITSATTQNINYNTTPATITCSVATSGSCTPTYSYQWQYSIDNVSWANITGQTGQNLTFSAGLTTTTYYRRMVNETNSSTTAYSNTATVFVYPQVTSSISPSSINVNYNNSPGQLTNTRGGGNGSYTYQWKVSGDQVNWTNVATTQNYTPPALTALTYYKVVMSSNGVSVNSNTATITVYPQLASGTLSPSSFNVNYNSSPGTITGSAGTGGNGSYVYQWQQSTDNLNWTNIGTASSSALNYTPPSLTVRTYYRRGTTSNGITVYSNTVTITVYDPLQPGVLSLQTTNVGYGEAVGTIWGTDPSGGDGNYTYAWESSLNNSTWSPIASATSATYSPGPVSANTYFRRKVMSNGTSVYSASVTVQLPLFGGIITSSLPVVASGGSATLQSAAAATGGACSGAVSYQWQKSNDEYSWSNIPGTSVTSLTATTFYRRVATCGAQTAVSNVIVIKVQSTPATIILPTASAGPSAGTQTAIAMPGYQSSVDPLNINYIKSRSFSKPGLTSENAADAITSNQDVQESSTFFDGLGREIQTVAKQSTPAGKDIISATFYDPFGKVVQKYLPYTDNTTTGSFKTNASAQQPAFYNNYFSNVEGYYYANTVYDQSPSNRIVKVTSPGKSWTGQGVGVTNYDRTNDVYDSVRIWNISFTTGNLPTTTSTYSPGALIVHELTDEHNNKVVEYKDKNGHVVLKKVQINNALLSGHYGWLCTYYVYDDFDNLRFVISPNATQALQGRGWAFESAQITGSTIAKELCFSYEYDSKGRMITKKVPGAGTVSMVYDARDRVVMTQDSALRVAGKWLYTDYDFLNRSVLTGLWTSSGNRTYHQGYADTSISYPTPPNNATNEVLTQSYYDDYSWASGVSLPFSGIATDNTYIGNTNDFYAPSNTTYPYPQAITSTNLTTGMVTGTKVKIIGSTSTYIYTANFYDDRGRAIQVKKTNIDGGYNIITSQFDFAGRPLRILETHKKTTSTVEHTVLSKMQYDAGGRLLKLYKKVDNSLETTVSDNQYDELGNLKTKKLGLYRNTTDLLTYTTTNLETLDYTYNICGWLLGINRGYALPGVYTAEASAQGNRWFGMRLSYDYGFNSGELNGNISGTVWRSKGDAQQRSYGFDYDNANRILKADFTQNAGTNMWNTSAGVDFSMRGMGYDANGNILSMNQMGLKLNASSLIDSLVYGYNSTSNKLNYVTDKQNDTTTHLGDFTEINNNTSADYSYEGNGNLTKDNNKGISSITYNYLNLPSTIKVTGKGTIAYTYDATGVKWRKTTTDSTASKKNYTTYAGSFTYQSNVPFAGTYNVSGDTLQFIAQEEGRIRPGSPGDVDTMYYDYFIKDHLGNVRMVLTDQMQMDYYPAATLEGNFNGSGVPNAVSYEKNFYTIDSASITGNPGGVPVYQNNNGILNPNPNSNTSANSQKMYRLTSGSTTAATGLGITLKVMSGDKIDVFASSYWTQPNTSGTNNNSTIADIITGLLLAPSGATAAKGATLGGLTSGTNPTSIPTSFLTRTPPQGDQTPMAYVNWILFDEQFHYIAGGFSKVGSSGQLKNHYSELQGIPVTKNGYIYVYTSNQSPVAVYFDNVQVVHTRGPLLEETHYYPFGLTMAGISSKAAGGVENHKQFNGIEHTTDLDLNQYDAFYRTMDPQIGRWWQIDPKPNDAESPYSAMGNNPILKIDPLGDEPTRRQAAAMAAHVYGDKTDAILRGGWKVSTRDFGIAKNQDNGLKSQIYERTRKGKTEYVYATAGTEDRTDVVHDAIQPAGISSQYKSSMTNARAISNKLGKGIELTFTGHSLGGGEAAANAYATGRNAVTFNAAGVSPLTIMPNINSKIDAVIMLTDPLNTIQNASPVDIMPDVNGTKHYVMPPDIASVCNGHSMNNMLKAFNIDPSMYAIQKPINTDPTPTSEDVQRTWNGIINF